MYSIDYNDFINKVHGCWYGKCLGGAAGAPVEGIKKIIDVEDFSDIFNPDLPNDDLDLQLLWIDVMKEKGSLISSDDLANAWQKKCWYPFSEYGYFLKNYARGIKPPYTGIINNRFFKEGMGCPIRSEIWGIISAGNPELASQYAYMDACLDHADNSIYAEQFMAVIESLAFFESDIMKLINAGMEYIPDNSTLYICFEAVIGFYEKGVTWDEAREEILRRFSHPDFTNVIQNMGFILIALLWGNGDMRNTINTALRCGYDTDCTCASAASVVGIICGFDGIKPELQSLIDDYFICGIDVNLGYDSIKQLAADTAVLAMKTPNYMISIENSPCEYKRPIGFTGFKPEYPTDEGMEKALRQIKPVRWEIYGPYFEQLNQPVNPQYPSPHEEGSVLPDLVCMVNNYVSLDKEYADSLSDIKPSCVIDAYEDMIEIDKSISMTGQMCCYAKTTIISPEKMTLWLVVGNNDGFVITVNGKEVLKRDEIRYWTPYNNFTLTEFEKGENEIIIKLLRRTSHIDFSLGFRIYDGNHWHRTKWHTDLY